MNVLNIHERTLDAPFSAVGKLIDTLSSPRDALWPRDKWIPMKFDRPLAVGAVGGHGPIRYMVEAYTPGNTVRFRFTGPSGFNGYHEFEIIEKESEKTLLRHTIRMNATGIGLLTWALVFRPLHDALLEDLLDRAQQYFNMQTQPRSWSVWVKFLRWLLGSPRKAKR